MQLDCLVIRQPYASLIAFGKKRWEFRSYESKKRARIGIAASPNEPWETIDPVFNRFRHIFPRGLVLATAELTTSFLVTGADLKSNMTEAIEVELHGIKFFTADEPIGEPLEDINYAIRQKGWQKFGWLLEDVKPLKNPIPLGDLERSTWTSAEIPDDEA